MGLRVRTFSSATVALLAALVGCKGDEGPACAPVEVDVSCAPSYEPTYENLFRETLQPSCGRGGTVCHGPEGNQGGLTFADREASRRALLGAPGVVRAGDPSCSELVRRVVSTEGMIRMPPGASLPTGEQCAIIRWIGEGAER